MTIEHKCAFVLLLGSTMTQLMGQKVVNDSVQNVQKGGQSAKPDSGSLQISLAVLTPTVKLGEPVKIRIELRNIGNGELAVERWLVCVTNGPACLSLEFEDEKGTKYEGPGLHEWMSIERRNDWWTLVAPFHYYGLEDELAGFGYDFLKRPGHYEVTARYTSKGGITPPSREDWNIPSVEVWKGEVVSNVAAFDVLPAKK